MGYSENFIRINGKPATKNLVKGCSVYSEKLIRIHGDEYRMWDPNRSKIAAFIMRGANKIPIKQDSKVLYLGAASGTTVSHVSDMVPYGKVYAVEISPRCMQELYFLSKKRNNLIPILADAKKPEEYEDILKVDLVYEDVAQRDQSEILIKNTDKFLDRDGYAMIAIKARSIDASALSSKIFAQEEEKLRKKFYILEKRTLEPFEKDHMMFLLKKR